MNGRVLESSYDTREKTHGSICAHIFSKYVNNKDYELISIKTLDEKRKADIEQLITALNWCNDNHVNIISLSIGSRSISDLDLLKLAVHQLVLNNTLLIAACNNNNSITYPASMQGVIGVQCDVTGTLEAGAIIYNENDIRAIELTVGSLKSIEDFKEYKLGASNSYVVPYIAAVVFNLVSQGITLFTEIMENFKQISPNKSMDFSFLEQSYH